MAAVKSEKAAEQQLAEHRGLRARGGGDGLKVIN